MDNLSLIDSRCQNKRDDKAIVGRVRSVAVLQFTLLPLSCDLDWGGLETWRGMNEFGSM